MAQYTRRSTKNPKTVSELVRGLSSVPNKVRKAAVEADRALSDAGVRHLYCGGIAVAAYGYERSTKDVDFLVGDEAFRKVGKIVYPRPDVPFEIDGVLIDAVTVPAYQALVEQELNTNTSGVVSLPFLVLMKLAVYRPNDKRDVVALLGVDAGRAALLEAALQGAPVEIQTRLKVCIRESSR